MTVLQDSDQSRPRDAPRRRTAQTIRVIAVSILINGLILLTLLLIAFRPPAPGPPKVIIAVPAPKTRDDIANQTIQKLQPFIDTSRPSASGMQLPITASTSAFEIVTPDLPSLDPGTVPGLLSGFGNGDGDGDLGRGGDGFITTIDGMKVRAINLGVVLDVSGSMKDEIAWVRGEIRKRFPNADTIEVKGCSVTWGNAVEFDRARSRKGMAYQYKTPSTPLAIEMLIAHRNVDSLYWFSDLQDNQDEKGLLRLAHLLGVSPATDRRPVRLYVHSVENEPSKMLKLLAKKSGGAVTFPKPNSAPN